MISLEGVAIGFGDVNVLNDISFSVKSGERVSLLGPGGSGKSVILKILLGLLKPDDGVVRLLGEDIVATSAADRRRLLRQVGMAFQQGALFDFMTVRENLAFAMDNMTDLDEEEKDSRIKDLLEAVKLSRTESQFPFELSGGMKRRIGIARALCTSPLVAIFDEPTAGLDPVTSTIILNMILKLAAERSDNAQMVVTSNVEIGIRFAERVIVIRDGYVAADGPWRDLLVNSSDWVRNFLGIRFIGLDREYIEGLDLPSEFIAKHW